MFNYPLPNFKELETMLQSKAIKPMGNVSLENLNVSGDSLLKFPMSIVIMDAENLNYVYIDQEWCNDYGIESQEEFENKDLYYTESFLQKKHPDVEINFADQILKEYEMVLSESKPKEFASDGLGFLRSDGYCVIRNRIRVPLSKDNKIKVIAGLHYPTTKSVHVENLYNVYKHNYKDDMKKGNRLFLQYLGLQLKNFSLSTRQIEVLISLAKNRTEGDVARELELSSSTIATYVSSIKDRLQNQNLNEILKYFKTNDNRLF